jgi:hypothetical protein
MKKMIQNVMNDQRLIFNSCILGKPYQLNFRAVQNSSISLSSQPRSLTVGDFNNDGHIDIVVANSSIDSTGVFLSNDDGTFANQTPYSTGLLSHPYSVVVDHFNNAAVDYWIDRWGNCSIFSRNGFPR